MDFYFYNTQFDIGKNGVYEHLATYLNTLTPTQTILDYKYVEPELTTTIKIPFYSHQKSKALVGDYCKAIDTNEGYIYYYYVMDIKWRGKETAEVTLGLDTLNTYWPAIKNSFTSETHITRRLKSRWKVVDKDSKTVYPVIDSYPESFGTMPTNRTSINKVAAGNKWYLIYRTQYDQTTENLAANPVSCLCLPEKAVAIVTQKKGVVTWTTNTFASDIAYGISTSESAGAQIRIGDQTITLNSLSGAQTLYIIYSDEYKKFYVKYLITMYDGKNTQNLFYQFEGTSVDFIICDKVYQQDFTYANSLTSDSTYIWPREGTLSYKTSYEIGAGETYTQLSSFSNWYKSNKTDARLVKIRELPYAPFKEQYQSSTGALIIPDNWTIDGNILVFNGESFEEYSLTKLALQWLPEFDWGIVAADEPEYTSETKLWNSDFSTCKLIYDTQTWALKPEKFNNIVDICDVSVNYKVSDGMDNGFAFKFETNGKQMQDTDFGEYMIVDRVTDIPYYTNEYLNYLRYGKSVDEKAAGWNVASSVTSGIGSIATTTASLAFGVAAAGLASGGVGAIIGAAVGVTNAIIAISKTCSTAWDSIQSKIDAYTHQASSVSGTSDISLLNMYSGNRLNIVTYEPIDSFRDMLFQYFRLYGYATDEYAVPTLSSRHWFEYIQCEPVFTKDMMWNDFKDDIVSRMKVGFRVFHYNDNTYDFSCSKGNWENDIWQLAQ